MVKYVVIKDWVSGSVELRRWGSKKSWAGKLWFFNRMHDKVLTEPLPLNEAHKRRNEIIEAQKRRV